MKKDIVYPQYRRYHNGLNYFKIFSADELEEVQFIGERCVVHRLVAKILPDRNFIYDLTFDYEKMGVAISASEYGEVLKRCRS